MTRDENDVRSSLGLEPIPPTVALADAAFNAIPLDTREGVQRALGFIGWELSIDRKLWEQMRSDFVTAASARGFFDGVIADGGTLYCRRLVQIMTWNDEAEKWIAAGPAFVQGEWVLTMTREAPAVEGGEHA